MPRPRLTRTVWFEPRMTYFKPVGIPLADLEEVVLTVEELEAIRLTDVENVSQSDAAKKMKVSQPTFSRILDSAHKKVADALVNGKAIRVEGGSYKMASGTIRRGFGRGRGFRRGRAFR
jgi:predicted DNA-binding protein (UPF0251 family)